MSILIRGAKAPRICGVCPFERNGWPDEWEEHCMLLGRQVGYFGKKERKPEDCPIIEVPTPHGRLGNIDLIIDELNGLFRTRDYDRIDFYNHAIADCLATVRNAPTIIEAEEGEEE